MGQIYHLIITSFQNSYIWLQVFSNLVKIQKHLIKAELADREIVKAKVRDLINEHLHHYN